MGRRVMPLSTLFLSFHGDGSNTHSYPVFQQYCAWALKSLVRGNSDKKSGSSETRTRDFLVSSPIL